MPRMARPKFYAVQVGRDGPKIYNTWDECKNATSRFPAAKHKSFMSRAEAEAWLAESTNAAPLRFTTSTLLNILEESVSTQARQVPTLSTHISRLHPPRQVAPDTSLDASLSTSRATAHDGTNASNSPTIPLFTSAPVPSSYKSAVDTTSLSKEQVEVLERVKSGQSVFFTGSAGTGKSFLLSAIITHLKQRYAGDRYAVAVTASTGIASVHIDGCTIHSWSGVGIAQEPANKIAAKLMYQEKCAAAKTRWQRAEALILDEISMIDGTFFDKLEEIARIMRKNKHPFGGIQLVICGDFAQLPPVPGKDPKTKKPIPSLFAFEASSWDASVGRPILLRKVFRQKDQDFVDMLNDMRFGHVNDKAATTFRELSRPLQFSDGIGTTDLFPRRKDVDDANARRLAALNSEKKTYFAHDTGGRTDNGTPVSPQTATEMLEKLVAPQQLTLKVGAQVMLVKNLRQGILVNGTLGRVLNFCTPGQARQTSTEISDEQDDQMKGNGQKRIETRGDASVPYPLVLFDNGRKMLCVQTDFSILNGDGEIEARRDQVPLILAWAMSIHKSQGQTIQRCKVDLGKIFEKGQAYVALSRATSMDGLQVLNFNSIKVQAHPKVVAWYADLIGVRPPQDDDGMFDDDAGMFDEMHGDW